MVSFKFIATAVLAACAMAATTPDQVVANIKGITQKSQDLQMPASELTPVNGALVVIGQGPLPKVIFGFADIVTTAGKAFVQMQGMAPVAPGEASDAIFDSFREFVKVHQALLNILIGKAGLFTTVPFIGAPVAAVLRQIEMIVDTLANTLIDTLQGREAETKAQGDMLKATVDKGIQSYQGLQLLNSKSGSSSTSSSTSDPISQILKSITDLLNPQGSDTSMTPSDSLPSTPSTPASIPMTPSTPSEVPATSPVPSGIPEAAPSGGSPSGISLSSGDNTLGSILKPVTGVLQGAKTLPVKRAIAFQA